MGLENSLEPLFPGLQRLLLFAQLLLLSVFLIDYLAQLLAASHRKRRSNDAGNPNGEWQRCRNKYSTQTNDTNESVSSAVTDGAQSVAFSTGSTPLLCPLHTTQRTGRSRADLLDLFRQIPQPQGKLTKTLLTSAGTYMGVWSLLGRVENHNFSPVILCT